MIRVARAAVIAVLLGAVACVTRQPVREPVQYIGRANPDVVYVTLINNTKVTLLAPRVSGDSVFGTVAGVTQQLGAPLSHVAQVEAVQPNGRRTRWLVAGLTVAVLSGAWALTQSGGGRACDYSLEGTYRREPPDGCY